jgi:DMSO/TMAO reductase YedYZ molybdopterin-dependent catalytic subunit
VGGVTRLDRAGRRTNLAVLVLLAVAVVTGVIAFGIGTPGPARLNTLLHAAAGLGLLALVPWKQAIVRRGLRARRRPGRVSGLALVVLVPLCIAAGLAHSLGYFGLDAMRVHVAAGVAAVPFAVRHAIVRWQRPRRVDVSRRSALRAAALAGAAAGAVLVTEGLAAVLRLPGRDRRETGSHEIGSGTPWRMPVTQWFTDRVPTVDSAAWRLEVVAPGVRRTLGVGELAGTDTVTAVLDCTGGWYATQEWRGTRLDRLLPSVDPGNSIVIVSVTGYRRRLPARDAPRLLLATHSGGAPLSPGHGAPVRLVAPGRRGFWWVKWVVRVEVVDAPWWWQVPFPLR